MGRYRKGYKPMFQTNLWKVVTGDRVQVMSGRDKGRIGVVREVIRDQQWPRVVVEGVNMVSEAWARGCVLWRAFAATQPLLAGNGGPRAAVCGWAKRRGSNTAAEPSPSLLLPPFPAQVKRHVKATKDTPAGSISLEGPIHYSNVQLVDPQTHAPVRVRWRFTETGERVRARRACMLRSIGAGSEVQVAGCGLLCR